MVCGVQASFTTSIMDSQLSSNLSSSICAQVSNHTTTPKPIESMVPARISPNMCIQLLFRYLNSSLHLDQCQAFSTSLFTNETSTCEISANSCSPKSLL